MGQPVGGFPKLLRTKAFTWNPEADYHARRAASTPIDLQAVKDKLVADYGPEVDDCDVRSYIMYPEVFMQNRQMRSLYGDLSVVPTRYFLA